MRIKLLLFSEVKRLDNLSYSSGPACPTGLALHSISTGIEEEPAGNDRLSRFL